MRSKNYRKNRSGQTTVEYGLISALLSLSVISSMQWLGVTVRDVLGITGDVLDAAANYELEYTPPGPDLWNPKIYVPPSALGNPGSSGTTVVENDDDPASGVDPDDPGDDGSGGNGVGGGGDDADGGDTVDDGGADGTNVLETIVDSDLQGTNLTGNNLSSGGFANFDGTASWDLSGTGQINIEENFGDDSVNFYHVQRDGDFVATLQIDAYIPVPGTFEREDMVGLMVRDELVSNKNSRMVAAAAGHPDQDLLSATNPQWRPDTGLTAGGYGPIGLARDTSNTDATVLETVDDATLDARANLLPPYSVRITRTGDTFLLEYSGSSGDSTVWNEIARTTVGLSSTVYIGFFVANGDLGQSGADPVTATVSNFTISQKN